MPLMQGKTESVIYYIWDTETDTDTDIYAMFLGHTRFGGGHYLNFTNSVLRLDRIRPYRFSVYCYPHCSECYTPCDR